MQIKRRGRHTTPSQVEKVAEKAGKAAPAMAIAGVLVAVPHNHHDSATAKPATTATAYIERSATTLPVETAAQTTVTTTAKTTAKTTASTHRTYDVKSGNTLSSIAQQYYHNANDWQWLYHENDKTLSNPDLIYPGQDLYVPYDPPANYTLPDYTPKHAAPAATTTSDNTSSSSSSDTSSSSSSSTDSSSSDSTTTTASSTSLSGTLSCSGLEQLWEDAGGSSGEAFIAAEIAIAESGGNQYATNPSSDTKGYWQISPVWGSLSSYDALTNAEAAVQISDDGTDWGPWTTYTSGAYEGRC
jgi:LysM repeat protein